MVAKRVSELHQSVMQKIEDLLKQLDSDSTNQRVAEAMKKVSEEVEPIRKELIDRINTLGRNVRWEKFTIALYGETNAGKSTIIETLRILLREETKLAERAAFRAKEEEFGITEAAVAELAQATEKNHIAIDELIDQSSKLESQSKTEQKIVEQELRRLQLRLEDKKRTATYWQKLWWRFRKPKEEIEYTQLAQQLQNRVKTHSAELDRLNAQIDVAKVERQSLEERQLEVNARKQSLIPMMDGQIIGTGRSDYTQECHGYEFEVNDQRFELLDVPGIEGKEKIVIDSIVKAVSMAHAVFYVTGKPSAPQTVEEKPGILEKIREHLGDQTEVWTIFNKRITNPVQLEKSDLLSRDESASLAVLDEKMREHLGSSYQGHFALSALPAFLAVADCLVVDTNAANSRKKFLAKLSPLEVLRKSEFQAFCDWFKSNMVTDNKVRIHEANMQKVRNALQKSADRISRRQREYVAPLVAAINQDWDDVDKQLDSATNRFSASLQSHGASAIRSFESDVRHEIYGKIDGNLSNDDLKHELGTAIKHGQATLESALQKKVEREIVLFQEDLKNMLEGFLQRFDERQVDYRSIGVQTLSGFELHVKFDSGINYVSLIGAIGGGLIMLWNPAGWITLTLGAMTLIVGIYKSVKGFLSKEYKKSQQRKTAEKNIDRFIDGMNGVMTSSHDMIMESVKTRIDEIKTGFNSAVYQIALVNSKMIDLAADLSRICADINKF